MRARPSRIGIYSVVFLCCSCLLYSQTTNRGVIEGTVVNEKGQPVPEAQAYAFGSGPTIAAIRYVETDKDGQFRLDHLTWDTYHVFAKKPTAGYGDMSFSFYTGYSPSVTISTSSPDAVVSVHVGPPCGLLKIESVADAVTGEPIKDYGLTLQWASNPGRVIGGSFPNPVLIPSKVDVLVKVSAKGYKSWPATPDEKASSRIHLKPGEVLNLRLTLHRSE